MGFEVFHGDVSMSYLYIWLAITPCVCLFAGLIMSLWELVLRNICYLRGVFFCGGIRETSLLPQNRTQLCDITFFNTIIDGVRLASDHGSDWTNEWLIYPCAVWVADHACIPSDLQHDFQWPFSSTPAKFSLLRFEPNPQHSLWLLVGS